MIYKKPIFYIVIFISLMQMSCITNYTTRYLQDIKGVSYLPAKDVEYVIKLGDELLINITSISNTPSLSIFSSKSTGKSNAKLVYPDGTIYLPYVHSIKVVGLTLDSATVEIEKKIKEYIVDADVKVALANKSFSILGEGAPTGTYPIYKDRLTIFEGLALAGDLSPEANRKKINVIRDVDGEKKILEFDLRSKSILDSEYYYILPNDIIYLSRAKRKFYQVSSFGGFLGAVTSSLTFVLLVTNYSK